MTKVSFASGSSSVSTGDVGASITSLITNASFASASPPGSTDDRVSTCDEAEANDALAIEEKIQLYDITNSYWWWSNTCLASALASVATDVHCRGA